jgi:hypothetical protein
MLMRQHEQPQGRPAEEPLPSRLQHATHPTVAGAICVLVTAGVIGGLLHPDGEVARRLGPASALVTMTGALIAVATFAWSRWTSSLTTDQLGALRTTVSSIEDKVLTSVDLESVDDETRPDTEPAPARHARKTLQLDGVELEDVELVDVPVRILGDLVQRWRADGSRGRWVLGDLQWAARKPGRGNHPWILKFAGRDYVYRIAYGGRGKGETGTVTRHPLPDAPLVVAGGVE